MPLLTRGIDVSHYQGTIQWNSVAASGVDFCFIKATEGLSAADPYFQSNWSASRAAGLIRGAYHFGHASIDAAAQARCFYDRVRADGTMGTHDLPPVLDLETLDGQSPAAALQWAIEFMAQTDSLFGRQTVLYTDNGFWQQLSALPNCRVLASRPLWLAAYSATPRIPFPWSAWTFWQYSDGSANGGRPVPGVNGPVDQNWFAGSMAELAALG